jgi:dethiobiotin synthetase
MKQYFVTGIGTSVGKTVVSAVLVEKLSADYWKPVQSGDLDNSDTQKVQSLISNRQNVFHREAYRLTEPLSPHESARRDGITIRLEDIRPPVTVRPLIIEGAGGLMVPLNDTDLMIDLIQRLKAEVILVSKNYLGSINHTLLSADSLRTRDIPVKGIIFNGPGTPSSEEVILKYSGLKSLGHIPESQSIDPTFIRACTSLIHLDE